MKIKTFIYLSIVSLGILFSNSSKAQTGCHADFLFFQSPANGFSFVDSSYGSSFLFPVVSWQWDFGDGQTSTMQNPSHFYNSIGTFVVCLVIADGSGCTDTTCQVITVGQGASCFADFTYTMDTLGAVTFTDASTSGSGSGSIVSYSWSFGDGTGSSLQNPVHTYSQGSVVQVCLTITDTSGCSDTYCETIVVNQQGQNCQAIFSFFPDSATPIGYPVLFQDHSISNSQIISWNWDFGDGSSSNQQNPYHTFINQSNIIVCLTISDSSGCTATTCMPVTWQNSNCTASFTHTIDSSSGEVAFTLLPGANGVSSVSWNFGDGTFSSQMNPLHTYLQGYLHTVCLVVTDTTGCVSQYCGTVNSSTGPVQDLKVHFYHTTTVTPGFPRWTYLVAQNSGTIPMSGSLEYKYDNNLVFVNSFPVADVHDQLNHTLIYNFSNLLPNSSSYMSLTFSAPSTLPLGTPIYDTTWINPIAGDLNPSNNMRTTLDTVVGSWDPNDKAVSPKGEGNAGNIAPAEKELSYLIRFQNTGTASAINVVVIDTLDTDIQPGSYNIMESSHPFNLQVKSGNIYEFHFDNINLPDSNSNEPASHGFINFSCLLKDNLPLGTEITNRAAIYFDFNPPVITNMVKNTVFDKSTSIVSISQPGNFMIYPNPAQDQIVIETKNVEDLQLIVISNLVGQELMKVGMESQHDLSIDTKQLKNGIYLLTLKTKNVDLTKRLVISR